jgi:hypothetical protein
MMQSEIGQRLSRGGRALKLKADLIEVGTSKGATSRRFAMKARISLGIAAAVLFGTAGSLTLYAKPASHAASRTPTEVTGCLEQGPTAKEYVLKASDGTTWGINETDMLMNNYVDHTVTVSGDRMHPTAAERNDAQHFLRAYDVVVESSNCHR